MSSRRNTTQPTQLDKRIQKLIERKDKDNQEMNSIRRKKLRERSEADKERLEVLIARRTGLLDKIDELKERRANKQTERAKAEREIGKAKAKTPKGTATIVDKDKKIRQEINDDLKEISNLRKKGKSRTEADNRKLEQLIEKRGKLLKEEKKEIAKKPQKEQSKKSFEERKEARRQARGLTTEEARKAKSEKLTNIVKKFIPVINNNEGIVKKFGELTSNETKTLLRAFRNNSPIIKTLRNKLDAINVDNTTFRDLMGKDESFKDGMLNFVPFQIAKDFKPRQGSIQELVGEERVANLLQEFSIDKQSLINYLEDVDIDDRKQETEGQVGGGFPQGFSVEEQVFNSLQNYTRRSGLVAGTFESMNPIDTATRQAIMKKPPPITTFTIPDKEKFITKGRIYEARDALRGQIPIQVIDTKKNAPQARILGQIDPDSPVVFTKGVDTMLYDPQSFPYRGSVKIPGVSVAEVKNVGSKTFVVAHQAGVGVDVNKISGVSRTNNEMRFKSAIDPLHLPIDPNSGRFKTVPYKQMQEQGLTREPFFQKGIEVPKVSASGSLTYEFKESERQFDPRVEIRRATDAQLGGDRMGKQQDAELIAERKPRSQFPTLSRNVYNENVSTVPAFPVKGQAGKFQVPDEAIFKFQPAPISKEKLRSQRTIYPSLQQKIKLKGGYSSIN